MLDVVRLAWRFALFHRVRSLILTVCLAITFFLPLAVHRLTDYYQRMMVTRAAETPLVVGPQGSPTDLVLATLFFKGRTRDQLTMRPVRRLQQENRGVVIPLHLRYTAAGRPLVGASYEYFEFRRLRPARGALPQMLGDAVVGATVARELDLAPGDRLLSDQEMKTYDLRSAYPLSMRVTGVLKETGTADDLAVFTDIKTTWVIDGLGHGHADAASLDDPTLITGLTESHLQMSAAVATHNEITPEQLGQFHFHGDEDAFPVSAVIVLPRDEKAATIIRKRFDSAEGLQIVSPSEVVREIMRVVLQVKQLFDATFVLVVVCVSLLVGLVALLTFRLRAREFATLGKIGFSRRRVLCLQLADLAILVLLGLGLATAARAVLMWWVSYNQLLL